MVERVGSTPMTDVYLHIGLRKTGTTTVQTALARRSAELRDQGVLYPGGRYIPQQMAVYDLLGQRVQGDERVVAGAFADMVSEIRSFSGASVIVSVEHLSGARPRQARRLVRELGGHRVFVVVGVRDFARTVVSAWAQSVMAGAGHTWQEFITGVREPGAGSVSGGVAFWLHQDVRRVLDVWSAAVPAERIHIVTLPPRGSPPAVFLERFAAATALPAGLLDDAPARNRTEGAAEVEVIRRLNLQVADTSLKRQQLVEVVNRGIRPHLESRGSRPLSLPPEDFGWAHHRALSIVGDLRRRGHRVFGDLDDLIPRPDPQPGRRLDDVSDAELAVAAQSALLSLTLAHGQLLRRRRRQPAASDGRVASTGELAATSLRATGFQLRKLALERANRSRALAWAAARYTRRASPLATDERRR